MNLTSELVEELLLELFAERVACNDPRAIDTYLAWERQKKPSAMVTKLLKRLKAGKVSATDVALECDIAGEPIPESVRAMLKGKSATTPPSTERERVIYSWADVE